ncbi:MAG: amidohydrolase family protein, partial [Xanthomonadaceae bacterium]|nr:amidohydrolase family protein [Xanthomonadaceae bacterium]
MKGFRTLLSIGAIAFTAVAFAASAPVPGFPPTLHPADLVLRDATIATLDLLQPEAQALAIRDGRILAVGSDESISHYIGKQTKVLNLHGAFVTPGFIEGHGHLLDTGESLMQINVGKAANWDGVVAMVKAAVAKAKPGEWIVGFGWLESKWNRAPEPNLNGLPLPASLDAASPRNPVLLTTASYHGLYANALALKLAGIADKTPDPAGGTIVRDAQGHAIGMLKDTAADPVYAAYHRYLASLPPAEQESRRERALQLAVRNEVSKGITGFVDQGEDFETIDWLKQQVAKGIKDGSFPLRLYVNVGVLDAASLDRNLTKYKTIGYADDHFTVRGVGEDVSDGALGTHSAWFLQPYDDAPGITGKNVTPMSTLEQISRIA